MASKIQVVTKVIDVKTTVDMQQLLSLLQQITTKLYEVEQKLEELEGKVNAS